jgi:DNA excision repair protein ERCC-3
LCKDATEFLIAIAEPVSRPNHIHEYKLTPTSLYSAASVELKKEDIVKILNNFCKNEKVPQ